MMYSSLAITFAVTIGYFLGSISTGWVVYQMNPKLKNPRDIGSGSYGATNMLRLGSRKVAVITLLGDALKGVMAISLSLAIIPVLAQKMTDFPSGSIDSHPDLVILCAIVAALFSMIGHCFPFYSPWTGGGKGVATFLGIWIALFPLGGLIFIFVWVVMAKIWKYSSLAALIATLSAPLVTGLAWIFNVDPSINAITSGIAGAVPWLWLTATATLTTILVWGRHHKNIVRLATKNEPKIGKAKA